MDKIEIKGLEVFAHHGVYEEEQLKEGTYAYGTASVKNI